MKPLKEYITEKYKHPIEYDNKHRVIYYHCTNDSDWKNISKGFEHIDINNDDNNIRIDYLKNDICANIDGYHFKYRVPREFANYYVTDTYLKESDLKSLPGNPDSKELEKEVKELICRVFNSMPEPLFDN